MGKETYTIYLDLVKHSTLHVLYKQHHVSLIKQNQTCADALITSSGLKGALYRIWCGVNRLGDSGAKVV